ncbi:MAG TPA: hypothetical protein DCP68_02250 [Ruminococcus sp.]|nr:hypothetical protein [Ruminococcus sp.]
MAKPKRSRGGKMLLAGQITLIVGIIMAAAGAALLVYLYGLRAAVPQAKHEDALLIFPLLAKLAEAIGTALMLEGGRMLGILLLVQGVVYTVSGIVGIVRGRRLREQDRAEAAEKFRLLYEDGALTEEEYAEVTERLANSR